MAQSMLVKPGSKVKLAQYDAGYCGGMTKQQCEESGKLEQDLAGMYDLQERLYAEGKQALLVVLQGLDTAGKDGTIKHVMRGLNPQSCYVASFKVPTPQELAHDYLWRVHQCAPPRGSIAVFNRSHYEDVLVARVHKLVPKQVWERRYDQINAFEQMLSENGTRVLKFFLHISRDEQKRRLEQRIADPTKHWKLSNADLPERRLWSQYMRAYEDALSRCSTDYAPWYIVPADRKWHRNMVVANTIERALRDMKPKWPQPSVDVSQLVIE